MNRLKDWGKSEAERLKTAALRELHPSNPVKTRFISAWGLLITGILLIVTIGILYSMLHHSAYE